MKGANKKSLWKTSVVSILWIAIVVLSEEQGVPTTEAQIV